ncbi:hypothetical protein BC827DRAFT_1273753 [Russula dissimulans]|nr:hypothetical protein BC827DRAFT_1273753 [Russula dissimulans]
MIIPNLPFAFNIPKLPSPPTFEISPVPELIFLRTVKGLLSFVINLSLLDSSLILIIVLLVNAHPSIRGKAAVALSILLLVFGLEISFINVYVLVCSWLSPSTALEPLTVVILGILNSVMPIITDSILLTHIVIERIEHSTSLLRLMLTMAAPVFLKFGRLANAAVYIAACADFVLSSVVSGVGVPDMDILDAAQARSMQIACTLQMVDNSYQLALYYLNAFEQRRKALQGLARSATSTSTTPDGLVTLLLASSGTFLLPILLSAAQLAASRRWPDSDIPRDLERVKVIVNVAAAAATTLLAALKRWRIAAAAAAAAKAGSVMVVEAEAEAAAVWALPNVEGTETTALLASPARSYSHSRTSSRSSSRSLSSRRVGEKKRLMMFDVALIDVNLKEDQEQMAVSLPVA